MSINWNLFRIAARLAAKGDSQPLIEKNKQVYVKKEVERLKNETGEDLAGKNVDRDYRRKLDEEAQEAAKQGDMKYDLPYDRATLQYIEDLKDEYLPDQNQRKYFVLWLADERKKNPRISEVDIQNIAHYYTAKGFKQEVLKGKSFNKLRDEAIEFNESATPPVSTKFVPIISLDDLEPEVIDGMIITKVNKSSRSSDPYMNAGKPSDPEDAIENHLKAVGTDMGICIGSVYGKKIAKGEHDAFIMHDASEKPVAAMDLLNGNNKLREIKGRKNQNIEDPRIAIPFLKYMLKHFDMKQFEEAEDFWVPIIIASLGLDSSKFPGLSQDKKDFVDSISDLKDGTPKNIREEVIKAILNGFKGYSIDDLMKFAKSRQAFRAVVNKINKKTLPDLARRIIEEQETRPVVDILIRRLKADLIQLPFDRAINDVYPALATELPSYKTLAEEYRSHFKVDESKAELSRIIQTTPPGRPLAHKIVDFILSGNPVIMGYIPDLDIKATAPFILECPSDQLLKVLKVLPDDFIKEIINVNSIKFDALRSISDKAVYKLLLKPHLDYDAPKALLQRLIRELPSARSVVFELGTIYRICEALSPEIVLNGEDRNILLDRVFNYSDALYWKRLIEATSDRELAEMGVRAAMGASNTTKIYRALSAYSKFDTTFSGLVSIVINLILKARQLPTDEDWSVGFNSDLLKDVDFKKADTAARQNMLKAFEGSGYILVDGRPTNAEEMKNVNLRVLDNDALRAASIMLLNTRNLVSMNKVSDVMKERPDPQVIMRVVDIALNASTPEEFSDATYCLFKMGSGVIKGYLSQEAIAALSEKSNVQEFAENYSFLGTIKRWFNA